MTLSELIKEYRKQNSLSQRQFALKCGVSNVHISMIENNKNPKTGQPLTPTLPMLKKIADGMNISLDRLFAITDDFMIDMTSPLDAEFSPDEYNLISLYRQLDRDDQGEIRGEIKQMLKSDKYLKKADVS